MIIDSATSKEVLDHLDLAWSRVGHSNSDVDLPDPLAFADFTMDWPHFRQKLLERIRQDRYCPSHVEVVDLPKDRLCVRPLTRFGLEYRLIFEAAVFAAAPAIDKAISPAVYSYRWWSRERRLLAPVNRWIKMENAAKRLHLRDSSLYLARTDIASFYEYIEPDVLAGDLADVSAPGWAVKLLREFLRAFNGLNSVWGVPQGLDASGILANLYLVPLDDEIARSGLRHFRYSDDIYIFGKDWYSLRQILLNVNLALRNRHLNLSQRKTKIVDSLFVSAEFEDMEKDAINYDIDIGRPDAPEKLRQFFDKATECDPADVRDLKFSLTRMRKLGDAYAVEWLLENMGDIPHLVRESLYYLDAFSSGDPRIGPSVTELLTDSKLALYPYAEQHLLIYMMRRAVVGPQAREAAWRLLLDKNKDSFVREFAALYLGRWGSPSDGGRLRQAFDDEQAQRVQRALLTACYLRGRAPERWLKEIARSDPHLAATARYLSTCPDVPMPIVAVAR